jgi:hypothetical protein
MVPPDTGTVPPVAEVVPPVVPVTAPVRPVLPPVVDVMQPIAVPVVEPTAEGVEPITPLVIGTTLPTLGSAAQPAEPPVVPTAEPGTSPLTLPSHSSPLVEPIAAIGPVVTQSPSVHGQPVVPPGAPLVLPASTPDAATHWLFAPGTLLSHPPAIQLIPQPGLAVERAGPQRTSWATVPTPGLARGNAYLTATGPSSPEVWPAAAGGLRGLLDLLTGKSLPPGPWSPPAPARAPGIGIGLSSVSGSGAPNQPDGTLAEWLIRICLGRHPMPPHAAPTLASFIPDVPVPPGWGLSS